MNYKEILNKLRESQTLGSMLGLERMTYLMRLLGNPQDKLKTIHVGGTNGKGSVCSYLTEILKANDYKVGTYISPYLESPLDSIMLNGVEIKKKDFSSVAEKVFKCADLMEEEGKDRPTEFELLTAIAFVFFEDQAVDFVVLEVGLGGREDATNVIKKPLVSVFTSISIDHKAILGETIEEITKEKAGIIKAGCPVVSNVKDPVAEEILKKTAKEFACEFYDSKEIIGENIKREITGYSYFIGDLKIELSMIGDHQIDNSVCAFYVVNLLKDKGIINLDVNALKEAMKKASQKGRLEILATKPIILADGAHNADGIRALKKVIKEHFAGKRVLFVLGMISGKETELIVKEICSLGGDIVTTEPSNKLKLKARELCKIVENTGCPCESVGGISSAVRYIRQVKESYDVIIVTGSLYLAGRMGERIKNEKK